MPPPCCVECCLASGSRRGCVGGAVPERGPVGQPGGLLAARRRRRHGHGRDGQRARRDVPQRRGPGPSRRARGRPRRRRGLQRLQPQSGHPALDRPESPVLQLRVLGAGGARQRVWPSLAHDLAVELAPAGIHLLRPGRAVAVLDRPRLAQSAWPGRLGGRGRVGAPGGHLRRNHAREEAVRERAARRDGDGRDRQCEHVDAPAHRRRRDGGGRRLLLPRRHRRGGRL